MDPRERNVGVVKHVGGITFRVEEPDVQLLQPRGTLKKWIKAELDAYDKYIARLKEIQDIAESGTIKLEDELTKLEKEPESTKEEILSITAEQFQLIQNTNGKLENIRKILMHEIGHFIDACIDASFEYSYTLHPRTPRLAGIHFALWCSYIDGRLGKDAPFDLEFRQKDANEDYSIDNEVIKKAWEGKYRNYPDIVTKSRLVN